MILHRDMVKVKTTGSLRRREIVVQVKPKILL